MMPQADGYKLECAYMSMVLEASYVRCTDMSYIIKYMSKWPRRS